MPNPTKSDLSEIIDGLEDRIEYYLKERERHAREVARLSRLFIDLWENTETLRMRFDWLKEASENVVTACPDHLPGQIIQLADELGIEITGE